MPETIKYPRGLSAEELAEWLLTNAPMSAIINTCAILLKKQEEDKPNQIVVSEEDFKRIVGLFKIRGVRYSEGNQIEETRGRKPKDKKTTI